MKNIDLLLVFRAFKSFVFSYYWILYLVIIALVFVLYEKIDINRHEVQISLLGGMFALIFFIQQQKLAEYNFFQNLFFNFNQRYDDMNDILGSIKDNEEPLTTEQEKELVDYFNLCSEEYQIFKQGYVPLEVWHSWMGGFRQYWAIKKVRKKWEAETLGKAEMYYGFNPDQVLKSIKDVKLR